MEHKIPTLTDLRKIPTDTIVDAIITKVDIKPWKDFITSTESLKKIKDPDQLMVLIDYEHKGFFRNEKYSYMEKPTTTSKLGRFMLKYDKFPEVGMQVKVDFDSEGSSTIRIK